MYYLACLTLCHTEGNEVYLQKVFKRDYDVSEEYIKLHFNMLRNT